MLEKTKTVAILGIITVVLLIVVVSLMMTTKQAILAKDGSVSTISSTNFLKKS